MWFDLGFETRLALSKVAAPADLSENADTGEKKEIPLAVALPSSASWPSAPWRS